MKRCAFVLIMVAMFAAVAGISLADKPVDIKPGVGDIQQEEAVELAKDILCKNFAEVAQIINTGSVDATFGYLMAEYKDSIWIEDPIWIVEFYDEQAYNGKYFVKISRLGELISYQAPDSPAYGPGDDEMTGVTFSQPGPNDVSEREAATIAKDALFEIGDYQKRMDQLTTEAHFLYGDQYNNGWEPVWLIYFYQEDVLQQKMLLGYDGSYIDTEAAQFQFDRTLRPTLEFSAGGDLRFFELGFDEMTHEECAAFSQKWIPLVEEYLKANPYASYQGDSFYAATRYVYGVPGEGDMTEDEAIQRGHKAIIALGASEKTIEKRHLKILFDISNPEQHVWKLTFFGAAIENKQERVLDENFSRYRVVIDAENGEIQSAFVITNDLPYDVYSF